jgi:LAO/AO transport system kinase
MMHKKVSTEVFFNEIRKGNISYLSRAITLVESNKKADQLLALQLIQHCLPFTGNSIRIGITGPPGVGKSTFIEAFGNYLISQGKKVAVLAIDPSSSVNRGSILGDKTRMEKLSTNRNAFIRPSPAGNTLGGVAQMTKESVVLCEAAGFDVILIETVGVGQSETLVFSLVDFFLLLHLAGSGDELQGIKRGIVEMADGIVINKAEGNNLQAAMLAKKELETALHFYPPKENNWKPKVSLCSAIHDQGIIEVWEMVTEFLVLTKQNGYFESKRTKQNKEWLKKSITELLLHDFFASNKVKSSIKTMEQRIEHQQLSPFDAAIQLIELYKNKKEE